MSTTSVDKTPSTRSIISLNEKQVRLRQCLVACLKPSPRFDLEIRPGGKSIFTATFDKTAAGVKFGDVETSIDQIKAPAEIDLAAVEIDFENLTTATGFQSVQETEEVWESIKRLVQPAPLVKAVSEHPVLSDIKPCAATISADTQRCDELYAAAAPINLNSPRSHPMGHVLENTRKSCIAVLKLPSNKRNLGHTSTTDNDLSLCGRSSTGKATASLLSKPQHGSSGRLGKSRLGLPMSHVVILSLGKKTRTSAPW